MKKCLLVHLIIWVIKKKKRVLSENEKRDSSLAEPEAV